MLDASHKLAYCKGVYFCYACGCWAVDVPRKLLQQCTRCKAYAFKVAIQRIEAGKPPGQLVAWPRPDGHA